LPSTQEVLTHIDHEHPTSDLRYMDVHSDLQDHGIEDAVQLFSLPEELLAMFGSLGREGASRLHQFARDDFLHPLGLLETRGEVITVNNSSVCEEVTTVVATTVVARKQVKSEAGTNQDSEVTLCNKGKYDCLTPENREGILQWISEVEGGCTIEEVEEGDNINTSDINTSDMSFSSHEV